MPGEENKENIVKQTFEKTEKYNEKKVWTNKTILKLTTLVAKFEEFQNSVKKYVWMKISKILNNNLDASLIWQHVTQNKASSRMFYLRNEE